jgi:hypothetical protein
MSNFKKYLEMSRVNDEWLDYNRNYLVQRVIKDYDDYTSVDIRTFDTEEEAEHFANAEFFSNGNTYNDEYRVIKIN